LHCNNLFHDGLAYARHLLRRVTRRDSLDPSTDLPTRERRAVRVYAIAMVVGSTIALTTFALYGLPILIEGIIRATTGLIGGVTEGAVLRAVDSALIIAVEATLQVIFLITFYRRHRLRLRLHRSAAI
jgi:putative peptide zinc metalloprotease protein